jgi:hypothetical protein
MKDMTKQIRVHRYVERMRSSGVFDHMDAGDIACGAMDGLAREIALEAREDVDDIMDEVERILTHTGSPMCLDQTTLDLYSRPVDPYGELAGGRYPTTGFLFRPYRKADRGEK